MPDVPGLRAIPQSIAVELSHSKKFEAAISIGNGVCEIFFDVNFIVMISEVSVSLFLPLSVMPLLLMIE